jgi:hypothetical protein
MTAIRVLTRRALAAIKTSNALFHILLTMGVPNLAALVQRVQAILPQGQRGGEERVAMPPLTDPGPTIVEPRLSVEQMSLWSAVRCKNGNWKNPN